MVDLDFDLIPLARQCQLLGLAKSSYYYKPIGESAFNLQLMRCIDQQYTKTPFYGVPKMTAQLRRLGYPVGPKRVRRLMRQMGLIAIFPKPKTSRPGEETEKYPYLLSSVVIIRPNPVWSTDMTYIRLAKGFVYLVAIIDWFSRYVLSWELSNSLDVFFCLAALEKALDEGKPELFNSDQGSQFTCEAFTRRLILPILPSVGMGGVAFSTTSKSFGCGEQSSMRRFISTIINRSQTQKWVCLDTSTSTTARDFINRFHI